VCFFKKAFFKANLLLIFNLDRLFLGTAIWLFCFKDYS